MDTDAETIVVPEDLSELSDEDLNQLGEQIDARTTEAATADLATLSDEDVEVLEALADSSDRVRAEFARRADLATERASRAEAALGRLAAVPEVDEDPEEEVVDEAPEEVVEAPVPAAAAKQPEEDDEMTTDDPEPLVASGRVIGRRLTGKRPRGAAPREEKPAPFMVATSHVNDLPGMKANDAFANASEVAKAISEKRMRMGHVPEGMREYLTIATGRKELAFSVGHDAAENAAVFREARARARAAAADGFSQEALVASGGCCAPFTPLYNFFSAAKAATPVEDSLPTVQATRGGIRFIAGTDWSDMSSALDTYTCDDGTTGTKKKASLNVSCPTVDDAETEAVSQSLKFDNQQYRVFPELVEQMQSDLAVAYSAKKESIYLADFAAKATAVTFSGTYGMSRSVFDALTLSAAQYRARQAMGVEDDVAVYLPNWVLDAMATDLVNDAASGITELGKAYAAVADGMRERHLSVVWYRDLSTTTGAIGAAQAAGALNKWPTTSVAYLFSPGSFVKLDGGTLDVGLVRDSTLNQTNDLVLFMEEWIGTAFVGTEAVQLTITACPNGEAPSSVAAYSCASV